MLLLSSADHFQNYFFSKNSFSNTIRLSNSLVPDPDQHSVDHDLLDPNVSKGYQQSKKVTTSKSA